MRRRRLVGLTLGALSLAPLALTLGAAPAKLHAPRSASRSASEDAAACAALGERLPPDVRLTGARITASGTAWAGEAGAAPRRPPTPVKTAFCRVQGVIEKEIAFELWLPPASAWNRKFLGAGVGGDAGTFNFQDLPRGVNRGYAAATTDTGHKQADVNWMLGDRMRLRNYESRANHLLAVKSKALIDAYYGAAPVHSYFIGCSGGGRQGLKEMQSFPSDYDGIISGAGGPDTAAMTTRRMWEITLRDSRPNLMSREDWRLLSEAGVRACDPLDGVKDGVAEDPRRCRFDPAELQCQGEKTASCLTAEQVAFARQFYQPMRDSSGRALDEGLLPGVLVDSGRSQLALGAFGRAVRGKADWAGEGFDVGRDYAALQSVMPELKADRTDLTAFRKRGGKVILYSGWMDPAVAARMMTAYYDGVIKAAGGPAAAASFSRLYMMPGVFHCGGGPGPDQAGGAGQDGPSLDPSHDMLTALEQWVEHGRPPGDLVVSKLEAGQIVRTRPLCRYPTQARYRGRGSTDDARSFQCVPPGAA